MATFNGFYMRGNAALTAVRAEFPTAEIESTAEFTSAMVSDYRVPAPSLTRYSAVFHTDVFWLSFQSVVDAFEYYHWYDGTLVRALVYGCETQERTWERIEGTPEPWESEAFFDTEFLVDLLEDLREDEADGFMTPEECEAESRGLEHFWQAGELEIGRSEPYLSAQSCARTVALYYRFPEWIA
jgi:hypothetical protein